MQPTPNGAVKKNVHMKKYSIIFYVAIVCFVFACGRSKTQSSKLIPKRGSETCLDDPRLRDSILMYALRTGDTTAFDQILDYNILHARNEEFFYYSLVFANKFKYGEAYYHLYYSLNLDFHPIVEEPHKQHNLTQARNVVNTTSLLLSYFYLMKAQEYGSISAKDRIISIEKNCNCKLRDAKYYIDSMVRIKID